MTALTRRFERIGRLRFAVLLVLLPASLFYLAAGLYAVFGRALPNGLEAHGFNSNDFVTFWTASHLALSGTPELAYDPDLMRAVQRSITGSATQFTPWHYPPTFLLAVLPLALLPYGAALILWLIVPLAALAWLAQRLFRSSAHAWALPIFPAAVVCIVSVQNGFLTAFLIGAALLHLERRPVLAGICCGLLTWKPHLAGLLFVALLAGGYWRALASAAMTALVLAAVSVVVLGPAPWQAFIANLPYVTGLLEGGALPAARMPSVYVSVRLLGADLGMARVLQAAVALAALATVCAVWYRGAALPWRGAAIAAALPLLTPYVFDYDLVLLAFAFAWLSEACLREGWQPGDTALLVALWIGPALSWPLLELGGPPFLPLVFALLLYAVWRRAFPRAVLAPVPTAGAV